MFWKRKLFCVLPAAAFFFGCASSSQRRAADESLLPEVDVLLVKDKSDEALKLAQEVNLDVEVLSTKIADFDNRITSLSDEVSSVSSSKIEELEARLVLLTEAIKELKTEAAQPAPASPILPAAQAVGAVKGKTPSPRDASPKSARSASSPTFSPSSASGLLVSPEFESYQGGLRLYGSNNFEQAIKAFSEMLSQFPSGKYADCAQYWIGESYFSIADYSSAISAFKKVLDFHGSSKADHAQYKIALAYLKMGQQGTAKEALSGLIEQYPGSEYIARAKRYLKQLR